MNIVLGILNIIVTKPITSVLFFISLAYITPKFKLFDRLLNKLSKYSLFYFLSIAVLSPLFILWQLGVAIALFKAGLGWLVVLILISTLFSVPFDWNW